ncbi:MAG: TonB-dependent receptor [Bryobacterales bacterium]|nr:TonB-dependent receptor [Bryobacterales bacterium]
MIRIILLAALSLAAAWAQTSQGRITGRVVDASGAVIPKAEVIARNESTGVPTRVVSNEAGVYVLPFLTPASYSLTASATGFKRYERKGIDLGTADVLEIDLHLEVGNLAETVEVSAEAPLIESASSTVGQFIESKTVAEMPLAGRRALELVRLSGNVVFVDYANNSKPRFSVAGGRSYQSGYMLDGGNIQNLRIASAQVDIDPPVEVIQEFKLLSNGYSAEYGGSASGLLVSTTKSGTNSFHGSLFEFFRNEKMDAANFFAPTRGTEKVKAPLRYNLFGGTLGGPIIKNRTHFFAGYEGTRRSDGESQILTVPTPEQRGGNFSQTFNTAGRLIPIHDPEAAGRAPFPGNVIPASRLDPVALKLLPYFASPNRPATNVAGAQNFNGNRAQVFTRDNITARTDHAFNDRNRFYFRFVYNNDPYYWTSVLPNPIADTTNPFGPITRWQTSYLAADTHTWTPNLIMDTRYSFSNRKFIANSAGFGSKVIEEIGLRNVPVGAFPALNITGISGIGNSSFREQAPIRQHQIINNWTWVKGKHFVKFGGEARKSINKDVNRPIISGQYNFVPNATGLAGNAQTGYGLASFLLGYVNQFQFRETDVLDRYNYYLATFVQDDWKVTRDLTLNIGLRWEIDTPLMDKNNRMNSFDLFQMNPVSGTPGVVKFLGVNGWRTSAYDTDWNNFGPRFGFAWKPKGSESMVVRGGYGIFFGGPDIGVNGQSLGFERSASQVSPDNGVTPVFVLRNGPANVSLSGQPLDDRFGAVRVGQAINTNVDYFNPNRATTYAQQFNLGVQRQFWKDLVLEVSYVANLSRKIPGSAIQLNQVRPELMAAGNAQVRRPFPQFGNVSSSSEPVGMSNYHSGMVRAEKRFKNGLSFLGSYTFARTIGNATSAGGDLFGDNQIFMDIYNRGLDKGPDALDIIHRFSWSSVYELPLKPRGHWYSPVAGGWTVGSIINMQSGGPFTVLTQVNNTNSFSAGGNRANLLRDGNLPSAERTVNRWFDTTAFGEPAPYTFGNAGRGVLRADGRVSFDISLAKNFYFMERNYVQLRGEFFNAFNHPDFAPPARALGAPAFGTITSATQGRSIQLGVRVVF